MHSLIFDPALVGRLKQFLISIAIQLKSAKKRSCLIFAGKLDSVLLRSFDIQPKLKAANKIP